MSSLCLSLFFFLKLAVLTIGISFSFQFRIPLLPTTISLDSKRHVARWISIWSSSLRSPLRRFQAARGAMDPNLKLILDAHRFDDHDAKWEHRFADIESTCLVRGSVAHSSHRRTWVFPHRFRLTTTIKKRLTDLESLRVEHIYAERDDRVTVLEATVTDLGPCRPDTEAIVNDLNSRRLTTRIIGTARCSTPP